MAGINNIKDKKIPKIGFCLIQNKFEVGADKSKDIYDKAVKEFSKYSNIVFCLLMNL